MTPYPRISPASDGTCVYRILRPSLRRAEKPAHCWIRCHHIQNLVHVQLVNLASAFIESDEHPPQIQRLAIDQCIDVRGEANGASPFPEPIAAGHTPAIDRRVTQENSDGRADSDAADRVEDAGAIAGVGSPCPAKHHIRFHRSQHTHTAGAKTSGERTADPIRQNYDGIVPSNCEVSQYLRRIHVVLAARNPLRCSRSRKASSIFGNRN